jgi:hypothetical protein
MESHAQISSVASQYVADLANEGLDAGAFSLARIAKLDIDAAQDAGRPTSEHENAV